MSEIPGSDFPYRFSRLLARFLAVCLCRTRILHRERSALDGGWILAVNHISHFDPPILSAACLRKIDWMAMSELYANRWASAWLRGVDAFPVNRKQVDRAAVRTALDRLRERRVVGIFPEGGIRDGANSVLGGTALRKGLGALAQISGAPVVPCLILGTDRLYRPRHWLPLRQIPVWIIFGEAMLCSGKHRHSRGEFETRVGEVLRELCAELRNAGDLSDDDLPKPPALRRMGK